MNKQPAIKMKDKDIDKVPMEHRVFNFLEMTGKKVDAKKRINGKSVNRVCKA